MMNRLLATAYLHSADMDGRRVQFASIPDGDGLTLFDCGLSGLCRLAGVLPDGPPVHRLILSHADADHIGDAAYLKAHFPSMQVAAHGADRCWIESPARLVRERYDHARTLYQFGYSPEQLQALESACGSGVSVDCLLEPGMELGIGDRTWKVLHVPGHSRGHIALWEPADGVLLLGDAILGFGVPSIHGDLALPPTHQFIREYLGTIRVLKTYSPQYVLTGHWPVLDGRGFLLLLHESLECVERDLTFVSERVRLGSSSFSSLMEQLNERFRRWPRSEDVHYSYALAGYLEYLLQDGDLEPSEGLLLKA